MIEHVLDPLESLRASFHLLKPGGVLFGETPNTACLDFTLFGRCWGALHFPRHITFFNQGLLAVLTASRFRGHSPKVAIADGRLERRHSNLLSDRVGLRVPSTEQGPLYLLLVALVSP